MSDVAHIKRYATLTETSVDNARTLLDPNAYPGHDNSFTVEQFKRDLAIDIIHRDALTLEFDVRNIDAPLANALRRVILTETPSMAIEQVVVKNNTSVLADEVLAHRVGLVPLVADPADFAFSTSETGFTPNNVLVFRLKATAPKQQPGEPPIWVTSRQLQWVPIGDQAERFAARPPRPVSEDILLAKIANGQEIDLEVYAIKGIGKVHAKWTPVGTAWYRMHPHITVTNAGADAEVNAAIAASCAPGVFAVDSTGRLQVVNERACTACRECLRVAEGAVVVERTKDHFIFTIESLGSISPERIVMDALDVLMAKSEGVGIACTGSAPSAEEEAAVQAADAEAAAENSGSDEEEEQVDEEEVEDDEE